MNRIITVLLALICMTTPAMAADWQQFQYGIVNSGSSPADAPDESPSIANTGGMVVSIGKGDEVYAFGTPVDVMYLAKHVLGIMGFEELKWLSRLTTTVTTIRR